MNEPKQLNLAEQTAVNQIRKWPCLYPNSHEFFHCCIISNQASFSWENGLLISTDLEYTGQDDKDNPIYKDWEFQIPEKVAINMSNSFNTSTPTVNLYSSSPINNLPDDLHPDWQKFISFHLFLDTKITPELYLTLSEAKTILQFGIRHNPHSSEGYNILNWTQYHSQIPNFQAKLDNIREFQTNKQIPLRTFIMQGI